jgi:hypothetical protein
MPIAEPLIRMGGSGARRIASTIARVAVIRLSWIAFFLVGRPAALRR